MQHALNHQLDETPEPETDPSRILLWMIRKWVAAHKGSDRARETLAYAMAEADAPRLKATLDTVMETLTRHAARRITVVGSCSPIISGDEQLLLDAVALAQAESKVETGLILSPMLRRSGVLAIGSAVAALAHQLVLDGVRLRQPGSSIAKQDVAAPCAATAPALQQAGQ